MSLKSFCISLILLLFGITYGYAQETITEIRIDFRVNSSVIDADYNDNALRVSEIITLFNKIKSDSSINIKQIQFCGCASPEGSYQLNKRLAHERLEALEKLIRAEIYIPDSLIYRDDEYIPWHHLAEMVSTSEMEYKEEILSVINGEYKIVDYPGGRHIDSRVPALQKMRNGKIWKKLKDEFFSPMRNACAVLIIYKEEPSKEINLPILPEESEARLIPNQLPSFSPQLKGEEYISTEVEEEWQRKLQLKTNLLGWCLAIGNVGVEIDLFPHLSVGVPIYYSALNYFTTTVKFRTFAIQPEIRYWFTPSNEHWFVGVHFGLAYYNTAIGGDYRIQDHDGKSPALGGGVNIGYRLPLSEDKKWKMEFSIGAGIYSLYYDKFHNYHNGLLVSTTKETYFGIDQATITLTYSFDLNKTKR